MYSFANRKDTRVVDEPMYAFYLHETGIQYHPCTEEILADLPTSLKDVLEQIFFKEMEEEVYFIKGMAHHYVEQELSFLLQLQNVFLVRNPYQLIASFAQVVKEPTMRDIGIKRAWEIAQFLNDHDQPLVVIDSNDVLEDPESTLKQLCQDIDIPT